MLTVSDLTSLDTDDVRQTTAELVQLIQGLNPNIDLKRGNLYDLLLYTSGVIGTANQQNIDLVRQSTSLLLLSQNPSLANDSDLIAGVASNFRLVPLVGVPATGTITIKVSQQSSVIIPNQATFVSNTGVTYATTQVYTARTNAADVIDATDRLLAPVGDGNYYFNIDITATTNTPAGNIGQGSQLTPGITINNLVSCYAATTFTGGRSDETTEQLIGRLPSGICQKSTSNRMTIDGLIKSTEGLEDVKATSIVGYGDVEMIRYHSVIPISFGGRVDVYCRTAGVATTVVLTKTATLITPMYSGNSGLWQISLSRDDFPGFYEISKITQTSLVGNGYATILETRGNDLSVASPSTATDSTTYIPDIVSTLESTFSRYQTTTIQFLDTDTATNLLSPGATHSYAVAVTGMPNIEVVQDLLSSRTVKSNFSDCLVKAPVPCFVTLVINIDQIRGTTAPDTNLVASAVSDGINNSGFPGVLQGSQVAAVAQSNLPSTSRVTGVSLAGRIRRPNNSIYNITSTSVISVPDEPSNLVTARTVAFVSNPDDIIINVAVVDVTSI